MVPDLCKLANPRNHHQRTSQKIHVVASLEYRHLKELEDGCAIHIQTASQLIPSKLYRSNPSFVQMYKSRFAHLYDK